MSSLIFLLAPYVLLMSPAPNDPVSLNEKFGKFLTEQMCEDFVKVAIELEIMDKREIPFYFKNPTEWYSDLVVFRNRYDNVNGCPRDAEKWRFPNTEEISNLLTFNRNYREYLVIQYGIAPPHEKNYYIQCIEETDSLYVLWNLIKESRLEYYYVHVRRLTMKGIIDKIGYDNFYNGTLPPVVPIWRFSRQ